MQTEASAEALSHSGLVPMPIDPPAISRPAPARAAVSLPTSTLLSGLFGDDPVVYKTSIDELDLTSLLDNVPTDPGHGERSRSKVILSKQVQKAA